MDELKNLIDNCEIISFDIFDTLLIRDVLNPTDIFKYIEIFYGAKGFFDARINAEKRARVIKKIRNNSSQDIDYDSIYRVIEKEYLRFKEYEKETEKKFLHPNLYIYDIFNYAKNIGKKIIIVSDMYYESEFLSDLLINNGYCGYEKIYVSSETQKTKASGDMYDLIINNYNISPNKILHIGDNEFSDIEMAKFKGINTWHSIKISEKYRNNPLMCYLDSINNKDFELFKSLYGGKYILNLHNRQHKDNGYWYDFGYFYGGILAYAFVQACADIAKLCNLSDLFFIARDGYILKEIFDKFYKKSIGSHYIYAQKTIAYKCDINNKEYSATTEKEYIKYLKSIELKGNNIGIVDSSANKFGAQSLLTKYLPEQCFTGIYLSALSNVKFDYFNLFGCAPLETGFNWFLAELILTSTEPPIIDISNFMPIYKNNCYEQDRQKIYKDIAKGEMDFASDFDVILQKLKCWSNIKTAKDILSLYWNNRIRRDNENLTQIKHAIDEKSTKYLSLVIDPSQKSEILDKEYVHVQS